MLGLNILCIKYAFFPDKFVIYNLLFDFICFVIFLKLLFVYLNRIIVAHKWAAKSRVFFLLFPKSF